MKKALLILESLIPVAQHENFFSLLFDVVSKTEEIAMTPSASGKSVNILNFPVSNTRQLESDECVAKLISAVKDIPSVSTISNQSNDYDTPLLSICPSSSSVSSEEKNTLFAKYRK